MSYQIQIHQQPLLLLADTGPWDDLLNRSASNTIFMSSAWLRATVKTFGGLDRTVIISVSHHQQWIAAIALQVESSMVQFLGHQMADYLDILWDRSLKLTAVIECFTLLFKAIDLIFPFSQYDLHLQKIRVAQKSPEILAAISGIYPIITNILQAPAIEFLPDNTFKKSKHVQRKLKCLAKLGSITQTTYDSAYAVLPKLPYFFALHRKRWQHSAYPHRSMPSTHEVFYQALTEYLATTHALRFNELCLNGRPIAYHFGALYHGSYTLYKVAFDPDFSQFSAGQLLIDFVIHEAARENTREFDFSLGDEAYKFERATTCREVVNIQICISDWYTLMAKCKIMALKNFKKILKATGQLQSIRRWKEKYQTGK